MDIQALRRAVLAGATDLAIAKLAAPYRNGRHVVGILYEGPSMLDGSPIVVIVTAATRNPKTGAMLQVWIIRSDMHPSVAIRSGDDKAICGLCPHRRIDGKRSCYVNEMGPASVYRAYLKGNYKHISPEDLTGQAIRWGAYGEPTAMPVKIFNAVNEVADFWTGYTHQWHTDHGADFVGSLMASVDNLAQEKEATAAGWGTFRVGSIDGSDRFQSDPCPAEVTDKRITCSDCRKCDGRRNANIYVVAHGKGAKHVPAERLARKRAA